MNNFAAPPPPAPVQHSYGNGSAGFASPAQPTHAVAAQSPAAWPQQPGAYTPSPMSATYGNGHGTPSQPPPPAMGVGEAPPAPPAQAAPTMPSAPVAKVSCGFNPGSGVRRAAPPTAIASFKPTPAAPAAPAVQQPPSAVAGMRPPAITTPPVGYSPASAHGNRAMAVPAAAPPSLDHAEPSAPVPMAYAANGGGNGHPSYAAAQPHHVPSFAPPAWQQQQAVQPAAAPEPPHAHQPQPAYAQTAGYAPPMAAAAPQANYAPPPPTHAQPGAPVVPGDPRTLGFGTDQGRWLSDQLRNQAVGASNPYRQQRQY